MTTKTALTIGAITAFVFGVILTFFPLEMAKGLGLMGHIEGLILSRDVGAILAGLGVLNWLGRDAEGVGARAILLGNLAIQAFELLRA
jgi:hypothetical protein